MAVAATLSRTQHTTRSTTRATQRAHECGHAAHLPSPGTSVRPRVGCCHTRPTSRFSLRLEVRGVTWCHPAHRQFGRADHEGEAERMELAEARSPFDLAVIATDFERVHRRKPTEAEVWQRFYLRAHLTITEAINYARRRSGADATRTSDEQPAAAAAPADPQGVSKRCRCRPVPPIETGGRDGIA